MESNRVSVSAGDTYGQYIIRHNRKIIGSATRHIGQRCFAVTIHGRHIAASPSTLKDTKTLVSNILSAQARPLTLSIPAYHAIHYYETGQTLYY